MNENIDLTKILKNCPKGWKFYSSVYGDVEFLAVQSVREDVVDVFGKVFASILSSENIQYPIRLTVQDCEYCVSSAGEHKKGVGECTFFPSKDQRDWSKFTAPWYKKEKFDPKTLKPFDRVLVRDRDIEHWICNLFSHIINDEYLCIGSCFIYCIPYNDDTKHLIGTTDEAPEYYRYWED